MGFSLEVVGKKAGGLRDAEEGRLIKSGWGGNKGQRQLVRPRKIMPSCNSQHDCDGVQLGSGWLQSQGLGRGGEEGAQPGRGGGGGECSPEQVIKPQAIEGARQFDDSGAPPAGDEDGQWAVGAPRHSVS